MIIVNSREDFLGEAKRHLPNKCVAVEIGVLNGDFSKMILDIVKPRELVLIDPYEVGGEQYDSGLNTAYSTQDDYERILKRFEVEMFDRKIFIHRRYSYETVEDVTDNSIDFIYIDSSHLFFDVKRDLNDWLPKLKDNGIMGLHDYIEVNDFGVIKAVDEFTEEHNFEKIIFNTNGGDIALKRKQ